MSYPVQASASPGYQIGFYACGVPAGIAVAYNPDPALPSSGTLLNGVTAATSTLSVTVPPGTLPGHYAIAVRASYRDPSGAAVAYPPAGGQFSPAGVMLSVGLSGAATLSPLTSPPAVGNTDCTPPPPGFGSTTAPPAGVLQPYAYVTDPSPGQNGAETINGALRQDGRYVPGVTMHSLWYFPYGIRSCDGAAALGGIASCTLPVGPTPSGYRVQVQVELQYEGATWDVYTSFTVR